MINSGQFVNCVWMAAVLILLGLVPGLFQNLILASLRISEFLRFQGFPARLTPAEAPRNLPEPRLLAAGGLVLLVMGCFAYLAH